MKKLVFTATLLITIIILPFLVFSDGNEHEETLKSSALTKATAMPRDVYMNPQYNMEADIEHSEQVEMEFRVCG